MTDTNKPKPVYAQHPAFIALIEVDRAKNLLNKLEDCLRDGFPIGAGQYLRCVLENLAKVSEELPAIASRMK